VLRDAAFYGGQGGLTLTGGEPALQPEFAEAVLRLARAEGLHTAMETCGAICWQNLARSAYLDLVLFDLKHTDPIRHRKMAGSGNRTILENLRRAARAAENLHKFKLVVRVPLVPGFNANETSLADVAAFVQSLPAVREVHLLAYHTLGRAKYRQALRDE
jgi:pyruvate formate lyase activating enzyme